MWCLGLCLGGLARCLNRALMAVSLNMMFISCPDFTRSSIFLATLRKSSRSIIYACTVLPQLAASSSPSELSPVCAVLTFSVAPLPWASRPCFFLFLSVYYLTLEPPDELASSAPSPLSSLLLRSNSDEHTDANSESSAIASPSWPEGLLDSLMSIWEATTFELCEVLPTTYSVSCFGAALDLLLAPNVFAASRASSRDSQPVKPSPSALFPYAPVTIATLFLS